MLKGYYFITDASLSRAGNLSDVKAALAAGVKVVQYRDKTVCSKKLYEEAAKLREACKKITFLVNDRVDIALAVSADGVHLGAEDMPYKITRKLLGKRKIIGLTVHNVKEAEEAQKIGADYIGLSPIFASKTKTDAGKPIGVEMIKEVRKYISIPVIALGGIDLSNAKAVVGAGADGICAISAVVTKPNVRKEIEKYQALFPETL